MQINVAKAIDKYVPEGQYKQDFVKSLFALGIEYFKANILPNLENQNIKDGVQHFSKYCNELHEGGFTPMRMDCYHQYSDALEEIRVYFRDLGIKSRPHFKRAMKKTQIIEDVVVYGLKSYMKKNGIASENIITTFDKWLTLRDKDTADYLPKALQSIKDGEFTACEFLAMLINFNAAFLNGGHSTWFLQGARSKVIEDILEIAKEEMDATVQECIWVNNMRFERDRYGEYGELGFNIDVN